MGGALGGCLACGSLSVFAALGALVVDFSLWVVSSKFFAA